VVVCFALLDAVVVVFLDDASSSELQAPSSRAPTATRPMIDRERRGRGMTGSFDVGIDRR
jgi:hypothetical protein